MNKYQPALVIGKKHFQLLVSTLGSQYELKVVDDASVTPHSGALVLIDFSCFPAYVALNIIRELRGQSSVSESISIVALADDSMLEHRMAAFDAGCDDYLTWSDISELPMRMDRLLMNRIANQQLRLQLQQAQEMAYIAMSDTSDLGVNIQFLLDVNQCDSLDEIGMRLFQALKRYGISCSLQMRGKDQVKNMEENGMAKELESAMLMECRDSGRYVDFGQRSIMNYECVSLLVKNMPVDDPKKYGAIKDNVFSLLQGVDARVKAVDLQNQLRKETELVSQLAARMRTLVSSVDDDYQRVMRDIASVVDTMKDGVERSLHFLGMDEFQERAVLEIMERGVEETSRIFAEGIRTDESLRQFLDKIDRALESGQVNRNPDKGYL